MSAAVLLDRLHKVKQTGPGRWLACCPAHEDRRPRLSVRELDDGRVLINCFSGCGATDVLTAAGLEWGALFPEKSLRPEGCAPSHSRIPARDLLEIVPFEITVAALVMADVLASKAVTETQWSRFAQAASRIGRARDACH